MGKCERIRISKVDDMLQQVKKKREEEVEKMKMKREKEKKMDKGTIEM